MDQRNDYIEKLSARMVEWDTEIEKLESAGPESKSDYSQMIATLLTSGEVA